nr:MAG: nonstructural polyprotein [Astroviridae sp.]
MERPAAFSSIKTRVDRQVQAEVGKVVSPYGSNDVLARAKDRAEGNLLWAKFMAKSVAIVSKTVDLWYGLGRDGVWMKYQKGNIVNLDTVDKPEITYVEKAMCEEKLYAETRKRSLEELINQQNLKLRELANDLVQVRQMVERRTNRVYDLEMENASLKRDKARLAIELKSMKAREEALREAETGTWHVAGINQMFMAIAFLFFLWLIPAASAGQVGCTLVHLPVRADKIGYMEFKARCLNDKGNYVLSGQYDPAFLEMQCMMTSSHSSECKSLPKTLIIGETSATSLVWGYIQPMIEFFGRVEKHYTTIQTYSIDQLVVVALAMCFAKTKQRALIGLTMHVISYITGSKMFPLLLAIHYLPTMALPFLGLAMIMETQFQILIAMTLSVTLVVDAFMSAELTLMQRLSGTLLYITVFVSWQLVDTFLRQVFVSLSTQVLVTVLLTLTHVGYGAAMGTVTITNPDGTVTKHKRYTQITGTIAEKMTTLWQKAKAIRGVLPAFPLQTEAVCLVEAETEDGSYLGTGFRLGNYIYTAGHVVRGCTKLTLKWNGLTVQGKILGEIDLPNYTDTIARIQIPNAFTLMKSLRVARETQNDYFQMITYGQNQEIVTFTGWGSVDIPYFAAPFATHAGTSGSPVVDRTGKVIAMHFGSNLACSSGYILTELFRVEPPLKQAVKVEDSENICLDKVMQGVRAATADMMAKIEELILRVTALEQDNKRTSMRIDGLVKEGVKCQSNEVLKELVERVEKLEKAPESPEIVVEQAKGKTKGKARKRYGKIASAVKRRFSKMKMLTEEEYKRLQDEGFTTDEIREVVNNLREQAFLNWQIENEDDWDETLSDDEYELPVEQKARMKVMVETENKQKSIDIKYPDGEEDEARELLKAIVTEDPVPEGETHVVVYYDDTGAMYIDNKRVTLKKVKFEGHTKIVKNKETVIAGTPQQPKVQKVSTTTKETQPPQEDEMPELEQVPEGPVEQQKKRAWRQKKNKNDDEDLVQCKNCNGEFSIRKAHKHRCPKNGKRAPSGAQ